MTEKERARKVIQDPYTYRVYCPRCKSGDYLFTADWKRKSHCGKCGQKLDWGYIDDDDN